MSSTVIKESLDSAIERRPVFLWQTQTYGKDPEFQAYTRTTPLLLPFVPIYSLAKHKWLQA